jgi:hypothetical protein
MSNKDKRTSELQESMQLVPVRSYDERAGLGRSQRAYDRLAQDEKAVGSRLSDGVGMCVCYVFFTCSYLFLTPKLTNGSSALGHLKAVAPLETRRGSRSDPCCLFGVVVAATAPALKRFFGFS